jgi:hypothetical protein
VSTTSTQQLTYPLWPSAVTGKGNVQLVQHARGLGLLQFLRVQEIHTRLAAAVEEIGRPVLVRRSVVLVLEILQERAERRNSCARADEHDRAVVVKWENEG